MQIHHDRPQSELKYKIRAPLFLKVAGGDIVRVEEWSLSGLIYPESAGELPTKVSLTIPFQGVYLQFPVTLKPSGNARELLFDKLTVRQRETLAVFYNSILSGRMASTADMIASLDAPVDLVPMEETETERRSEVSNRPSRILRAIWSLTFYLCLAVVVFGIAGKQIWGRINTIRLSQSRIQAPVQTYTAPEAAYVGNIRVSPGQSISRNDLLVTLTSPALEGRVHEVRAKIIDAERRLAFAQDRLRLHESRADLERETLVKTLDRAKLRPVLPGSSEGHSQAEVARSETALLNFDAGRSTKTGDYIDVLQQLTQIVLQHKAEWSRLKRELSNRKKIARSLDIVATNDGIVAEMMLLKDFFVHRGTPLLLIEENQPRRAVGMLDERLSDAVYLGMEATIVFNSNGQKTKIPGRIINIQAGEIRGNRGSFSLLVTIEALGMSVEQSREAFQPNVPVTLILHRNVLSRLTQRAALDADT